MIVAWLFAVLLMVGSFGLLDAAATPLIVARCPEEGSPDPSPCSCSCIGKLKMKCKYQNKEDVVVTKELVESYNNTSLCRKSLYIQIANASSLLVTADFTEKWIDYSSSAFDIFHCGNVTLNPRPIPKNNATRNTTYFAAMGIINSSVSELPSEFLSYQSVGALRIKQSRIGVIHAGFLKNVKEIRYITIVDSEVGKVEGSVAAEGYITLSQHELVHSWAGFKLSNVTIGTLERNSFNFTHKFDIEEFVVENSTLTDVKRGALSASGILKVSITGNTFQNLDKEAFKVNVTAPVYFVDNTLLAEGVESVDAIREFQCHSDSIVQNNTLIVSTPIKPGLDKSYMPFHPNCGKSQLFMVLTPKHRVIIVEDTRVAWVLGALLAVLVVMMVVGMAWVFRSRRPILSMDRFLYFLSGRNHKVSLENLPRNIELNIPRDEEEEEEEEPEEGTSVKDLDLSSSEPNEVDQSIPAGLDKDYSDPQCLDFSDEASSDNEQDF